MSSVSFVSLWISISQEFIAKGETSFPKMQTHRFPVIYYREDYKCHAGHITKKRMDCLSIVSSLSGVLLICPGQDWIFVSSSHLISEGKYVQHWSSCLPGHLAVTSSTLTFLFPPAHQSCLVCPPPVWDLTSYCRVNNIILQNIFNFEEKPQCSPSCPLCHFQCTTSNQRIVFVGEKNL